MAISAVLKQTNEEGVIPLLQEAEKKLGGSEREIIVDFSSVRRVNANDIAAIEKFAQKANDKAVKIILRGINVDVYKVLKLTNRSSSFSFIN